MSYTTKTYGNVLNLSTGGGGREAREMAARMDKNRIVQAACMLRIRNREIKKFDCYECNAEDPANVTWRINITATKAWHKRFADALENPEEYIQVWVKQAEEEIAKAEAKRAKLLQGVDPSQEGKNGPYGPSDIPSV